MKKLLSRSGESLVESLVSILIVALSAAMLATMITASVNISKKANALSENLRIKMSNAENRGGASEGIITIEESQGFLTFPAGIEVNITDGDGALRSYWRRMP